MADVLPRTFATWLRDNAPLSIEMVERLVALDGRHPTLTELRFALGVDLDLHGAGDAALAAWPALRTATATDPDLCAVLDQMYRSLESPHIVRVEIGGAGPKLARQTQPIRIRDEEHLVLLAFADNRTTTDVPFSVEAHGEGIGGVVEARRTASALLDAGSMHPGSYLLPVMVVADRRPATIDVPIECAPSGTLTVRIIDDATGERIAARIYLRDDLGDVWPAGTTLRRDRQGRAWFHAHGSITARLSGRASLLVTRGIEYEAAELQITVAPDSIIEREVRLRRWSEMSVDGWYSGDVHVHLHYGGEYALTPEDAALAQRAEDLQVLNMAVANQNSGWVHDRAHFEGAAHSSSDAQHVLRWGEEYRNNLLGHMCMYGIEELVQPIFSGVPRSEHTHDMPANAEAAATCRAVGGTLSYAHPLFGDGDQDRIFAEAHSVDAKELPVDAALGYVDAIDVMSYPGDHPGSAALWYRLLNCGLRLAATAGTDTFMNAFDAGKFSNPPGGDRAFVRVDGALSMESWCGGVRAGRTFVTNGPMLSLEANGRQIGDELIAIPGDVIRVVAEAGSNAPMERIELIVNGEIVASAAATDAGQRASLTHEVVVQESCWIALRATGPAHPLVLDDALFAHTSPIYVSAGGEPIAARGDAAYFVEWIDRLIALVRSRGRFASEADRDDVIAVFEKGRAYFDARAS